MVISFIFQLDRCFCYFIFGGNARCRKIVNDVFMSKILTFSRLLTLKLSWSIGSDSRVQDNPIILDNYIYQIHFILMRLSFSAAFFKTHFPAIVFLAFTIEYQARMRMSVCVCGSGEWCNYGICRYPKRSLKNSFKNLHVWQKQHRWCKIWLRFSFLFSKHLLAVNTLFHMVAATLLDNVNVLQSSLFKNKDNFLLKATCFFRTNIYLHHHLPLS